MRLQLYGCTMWTLTKRMEKNLDGIYTRKLQAVWNKSWRQHSTKQQIMATYHPSQKLSKLDKPDMWDTAGDVETNLHLNEQRFDDQLEPIYNSSVPIQDVAWKISRDSWTIVTVNERGSGTSGLVARHDDVGWGTPAKDKKSQNYWHFGCPSSQLLESDRPNQFYFIYLFFFVAGRLE